MAYCCDVYILYSFEVLPDAKFDPKPWLIDSTMSSTQVKIQMLPSSLANHLTAASLSTSFTQVPSSNALRSPKTCEVTWGPTPDCARKHAIATIDVKTLPELAPVSRPAGSDKRAP